MARALGPTVDFRPRSAQVLGGVMVLAAALGVAVAATDGVASLLRFLAPLALFGLLGWAAFWRPYVEVSDGGVLVANTWRTVEVPWPAVDEVEGRYGLRLRTAYGSVTAWAAPAPAGRRRAGDAESDAAQVVAARLQELREAGYLDHRTLERPRLRTRWHTRLLATAAGLVLASVLLPLLA